MGNMRFKVGDRVKIKSLDWYNENKTVHGDIWFDNAVFVGGQSLYCGCELTIRLVRDDNYYVIENDYYWTDEMIEGLVEDENKPLTYEETVEIIEAMQGIGDSWECPQGYQFVDENGNVINATKIVLEKKGKEYPKTYEECCKVLGIDVRDLDILDNMLDTTEIVYSKNLDRLLNSFRKLLICRDAYWKIAGEEMGLGKPWEPDWTNQELPKYCIAGVEGQTKTAERYIVNTILAFPTGEMRDAFYENFKVEIKSCKELL